MNLPTIVYTADDAPEAQARYVATGVTEYLCKPIGADQLLAAIERVMTTPRETACERPQRVAFGPKSNCRAPRLGLSSGGRGDCTSPVT